MMAARLLVVAMALHSLLLSSWPATMRPPPFAAAARRPSRAREPSSASASASQWALPVTRGGGGRPRATHLQPSRQRQQRQQRSKRSGAPRPVSGQQQQLQLEGLQPQPRNRQLLRWRRSSNRRPRVRPAPKHWLSDAAATMRLSRSRWGTGGRLKRHFAAEAFEAGAAGGPAFGRTQEGVEGQGRASGQQTTDPNPFTYDPNVPWSSGGQGPCTRLSLRIPIQSLAGLQLRRLLPPPLTLVFELTRSVRTARTVLLGPDYACTVLRGGAANVTVSLTTDTRPVLAIWNTSNVLVFNISFFMPVTTSSPPCSSNVVPEIRGTGKYNCPAISIWASWGVQLGRGSVFGRVEVCRSAVVSLDSLRLSSIFPYDQGVGAVRVLVSGHGPSMLRSQVSISNCDISGTSNGIVLHQGAVGVDVYNNYIHDYGFAGIRCGDYINCQGDCMATNIFRNYIYSAASNVTGDADATGIYYQTHWLNPGNYDTCNYVEGGDHCYYLDNASSGVTIEGAVCLRTSNGVKINTGTSNVIKSMLQKGVRGISLVDSCLFTATFNCNQYGGKVWTYLYRNYYNTPQINKAVPWISSICTTTTASNGQQCNPPGAAPASQTGNCSGLPFNNLFDLFLVDAPKANVPPAFWCTGYGNISNLNQAASVNLTSSFFSFIDYDNDNLGVSPSSAIYNLRPDFRSCDRSTVGPRLNDWSFFYGRFNIRKPSSFNKVLKANYTYIQDMSYQPCCLT